MTVNTIAFIYQLLTAPRRLGRGFAHLCYLPNSIGWDLWRIVLLLQLLMALDRSGTTCWLCRPPFEFFLNFCLFLLFSNINYVGDKNWLECVFWKPRDFEYLKRISLFISCDDFLALAYLHLCTILGIFIAFNFMFTGHVLSTML